MLKLGDFLPVPAPRYMPEQDTVLAFCSPVYGPLEHVLPTMEINVPASMIIRCKIFAKAFLEGQVFDKVPPEGVRLLAQPSALMTNPTNPRVSGIIGPLWQHRIGSREQLLKHWQVDRKFLLDGY